MSGKIIANKRQALLLWVGLAFLLATMAIPMRALAQTSRYHMDQYNSDITVNSDGSLDVVETLVYSFDSGSFHRGLRTIKTDKVEGINNISVTETTNGQNIAYQEQDFDTVNGTTAQVHTFGSETIANVLAIRWIYDPTQNQTRTFKLSYHADGAIRVYANLDRFDWYGVPPDWDVGTDNSTVHVTFPEGVDTSAWDVASVPKNKVTDQGGTEITWSTQNIQTGGFEVGADIPLGVLQVQKPSWQDSADQNAPGLTSPTPGPFTGGTTDQTPRSPWQSLLDLVLLLLSAVVLIGGILWRLTRWYLVGRDKPITLPIDYLATPPSDLPPGLVGTLLDEKADVRDVIATITDLGRKGKLTIADTEAWGGRDIAYTLKSRATDYKFEDMVVGALFGDLDVGATTTLASLSGKFQQNLPAVYNEMYKNLVALKYFDESPEEVRKRAGRGFCAFFALAGALVFVGLVFGFALSYMLIPLGFAIGIVSVVRIFTSSAMPRKTDFGAMETAKWKAFKRYLQNIRTYTNIQVATDKYQLYLPYAVAMGIEQVLTNQFVDVPAAMPVWYTPYGNQPFINNVLPNVNIFGGGNTGGVASAGIPSPPSGPAPNINPMGAMQGMSDSIGSAMQGMSNSFGGMVSSASKVFTGNSSSGVSTGGSSGGSSSGSGEALGNIAGSVGGFLLSAAIGAVFGGGGGGGGGGGAD